jgi:hypothetical protein
MAKRFGIGSALVLTALSSTACGNSDADKPIPWIGHTYMLSLAKGDFSFPRQVGADLFGVAPTFFFEIGGSGKDLTAKLATGPGTTTDSEMTLHPRTPEDATQDSCGPTTVIPFSGADYPHSTLALDDARLFLVNPTPPPLQVTADVYGLKFTDVLPNGDTPSKTGTLAATMDFGQIIVLFRALGPTRDPAGGCTAFNEHYMVNCDVCSAGGSPYCLNVEAEGIGALQVPNLVVTDVTEAERPATCADSQIDPG